MRVQVTFETGHPSRVDGIDGSVAVVWQDQRPLRGLAARADWRLNGFLSRLVLGDRFAGKAGDWLLVHTQGRLPFVHLFLVGMGRGEEHTARRAKSALEGIAGKVALAGVHSFSIDLDEVAGAAIPAEQAMVTLLDALADSYPEDELSDPPYLPALEARERNEARVASHRRRRAELLDARRTWDAERQAEAAERARQPDDEDADGEGAARRPVAGHVPDAEPPPDPDSLGQPELEPYPERTVRVVLLGEVGRIADLRQALKRMASDETAPIDVEWSR